MENMNEHDHNDGVADDDTILGGEGDDSLLGSEGGDLINGGEGRDIVDGGRGDDTVIAGPGDVISGGEGRNTIVLSPVAKDASDKPDAAILRDYSPGDVIRFSSGENGPINARYAFDMAGNLVLADEYLNPMLVIRANEVSQFDVSSVLGAASFTQAETSFQGDLYKAGLAAVGLVDDDAITVMDPSLPGLPVNPVDPTDPTDPVDPVDPSDPVDPTDPEDPDDKGEDGSGGSGSCFVATAAYGSADHPDVLSLRRLRDEVLVKTAAGRTFVRLYWVVGPHLAARVHAGSATASILRRALSVIARLR